MDYARIHYDKYAATQLFRMHIQHVLTNIT